MNIIIKSLLTASLVTSSVNFAVAGVSPTEFSVGVHGQKDHYKSGASTHDTAHGFNGTFAYNAVSYLMFGVDGHLTFGHVNGIKTTTSEMRGLVGYNFFVGATVFTPYSGFGSYSKKFKESAVSLTQQFKYLPFGVSVKHSIDHEWDLRLRGEYNWVVSSRIKVNEGESIKGKSGDVKGYKVHLDFIKKLGGSKALVFGPYMNVWDYSKESSVKIKETGIKIAFHF